MSGKLPPDSTPRRPPPEDVDPCDIEIDIDLEGVNVDVLRNLHIGDSLNVTIHRRGQIRSAVCVSRDDEIVGSLTAFPGLVALINCLERGESYTVVVIRLGPTYCHVAGGRNSR